MTTATHGPHRSLILLLAVASFAVTVGVGGCGRRPDEPLPPPPEPAPAPLPDDIEHQVHTFCGGSCHAYPPPDSFPRKHWRAEVERGFKFFDKSGMAGNPPKLAHVVRYYEDRAIEDYPPATIIPASRPLSTRFETISYPPPRSSSRPMISNVSAVKLPPPGADAAARAREPFMLLACDMVGGRVLALRPTDSKPTWRELAKVPHPAHAEVVDLDGDGILDILVADLGTFAPLDLRCGSVVWLRGRPDGSFQPITLLSDVGRVADVRAADFRGTGKLDLVVGVFASTRSGRSSFWRTERPTGTNLSSSPNLSRAGGSPERFTYQLRISTATGGRTLSPSSPRNTS